MKKTAVLIIIGNEILSGRTLDKNTQFLAQNLNEIGISLSEMRVIPDIEKTIITTINEVKTRFDYVFTTGGIGPTHDDITSESIAKACGVDIELNEEAHEILKKYYEGTDKLNDSRLKMAKVPVGCKLIYNPVSSAPGFILENIHVMAGVPKIMQAMFDGIKNDLKGGDKIYSQELELQLPEGDIANKLSEIQVDYPDCDIGSYPFFRTDMTGGTVIVVRSANKKHITEIINMLTELYI